MIDPQLTDSLRQRLSEPLPGFDAQSRMAPRTRIEELDRRRTPDNARKSAVLILFYPGENGIQFPLILRNDYKGVHSGQIALPGGTWEETDGDLLGTALREANEEVGILQQEVEVLGALSELYIPPSNFLVQPYVGISTRRPDFVADPVEVASLIEAPLEHFRDAGNIAQTKIKHSSGFTFNVPSYNLYGHVVWGATAMMLSELMHVMDEVENRG